MAELHEQAERLGDLAEKVLRETERLRRDVSALAARLPPRRPDDVFESSGRRPGNFAEMFDSLEVSRALLLTAKRDLAALRAHVFTIMNDVVARDEMKEWLKDPRPPAKEGS